MNWRELKGYKMPSFLSCGDGFALPLAIKKDIQVRNMSGLANMPAEADALSHAKKMELKFAANDRNQRARRAAIVRGD
jgi:hypothetical protein